jgi:hypothetical protein
MAYPQQLIQNFGNPRTSRSLLVGLRKHGSPAIRFRALDVPTFPPSNSRNLKSALNSLILEMTPHKNQKVILKKTTLHWAPNPSLVGVPMTTDLYEEQRKSDRRFDAPEAVYRMLRLAAERGMGDVLMVDFTFG